MTISTIIDSDYVCEVACGKSYLALLENLGCAETIDLVEREAMIETTLFPVRLALCTGGPDANN
jgi:hypothetical protein